MCDSITGVRLMDTGTSRLREVRTAMVVVLNDMRKVADGNGCTEVQLNVFRDRCNALQTKRDTILARDK